MKRSHGQAVICISSLVSRIFLLSHLPVLELCQITCSSLIMTCIFLNPFFCMNSVFSCLSSKLFCLLYDCLGKYFLSSAIHVYYYYFYFLVVVSPHHWYISIISFQLSAISLVYSAPLMRI